MRGHNLLFALSIAFAAVATSQEVFAEASPSRPAVLVKTMTMDEVVQPDGSYTTLFHVERLATNQSAAQKIAQQTVEYSESMETAEIEEALTRKVDGNVLKVDRTQIFAQAPPGSPQVPMFTDRKQKVIVFPDVGRMTWWSSRSSGLARRVLWASFLPATSSSAGLPSRMRG